MSENNDFDIKKTRQLILYLASQVDIGKTKLMKLLYLIDFIAYEKTGKPITNDTYEHWALGPVPKNVWKKCDALLAGIIKQVAEERTTGKYTKFVPTKPADLSVFTKREREIIDEVIEKYGHIYQRELVNIVHDELPYKLTRKNERIPYYLAPYRHHRKLTAVQLKKLRADKAYTKRLRGAYEKYKREKTHHHDG